jgi:hypothetical protein
MDLGTGPIEVAANAARVRDGSSVIAPTFALKHHLGRTGVLKMNSIPGVFQ